MILYHINIIYIYIDCITIVLTFHIFNPVMPAKVAKDLHCCHPDWWGVQDFQAEIIIFSSGIDPNFKSLGPQISGCKFIYSIYVYLILYIYIIFLPIRVFITCSIWLDLYPSIKIIQNPMQSRELPNKQIVFRQQNHISNPYGGFLKWIHPKPSKTMQPLESCNHGEERGSVKSQPFSLRPKRPWPHWAARTPPLAKAQATSTKSATANSELRHLGSTPAPPDPPGLLEFSISNTTWWFN